MEVKHRCNQILELGFPLGGIAQLFAQDWEGDVTVVMPATLAQVDAKKMFKFWIGIFSLSDMKISQKFVYLKVQMLNEIVEYFQCRH
jgi:hypothetical protein